MNLAQLMYTNLASSTSISDKIVEWSVSVMESLGGPGTAILVAAESVFPPIPSEIILPLAGFTASQGNLSFVGAIIWATIGSVVGAGVLYYLGAILGRERIRHYGNKLPLVKMSDVDKAEKWFKKHENQAVFYGRMVPVVRSLVSIPAGVELMPVKLFLIYTAAGSAIWNTGLITAGYILGENWHIVETYISIIQYLVLIGIIGLVGLFIYKRIKVKQKH